jgi:Ca-activated chloride channel family protein
MAAPSLSRGVLLDSITIVAIGAGVFWVAAPRAQFSSGVSAVEVYATVTDEKGEPVRDLSAGDFQVFEDGIPQSIATFVAGEFPLTAAVALDRSFSMSGARLDSAKRAVHTFLDALRPEDAVVFVRIGSTVDSVADRSSIRAEVDRTDAFGTTAMHDAIIAAIDAVDASRGRRALVLVSDGIDRYSRATASEVLARARRSNVLVYPIALGRERPELFAELAALTGGRSSHARDGRGLAQAVTSIARELRVQYLLGYSPSRPIVAGAREWRSISVRVTRPRVRVRARDGYHVE